VFVSVCDTVDTCMQYLALSKAWWSCCRWSSRLLW